MDWQLVAAWKYFIHMCHTDFTLWGNSKKKAAFTAIDRVPADGGRTC